MRIESLRAAVLIAFASISTNALAEDVSNFSMVGFPVEIDDVSAFNEAMFRFTQTCEAIELDDENIACVQRTDAGGELWIGLRAEKGSATLITANPAFVGESEFPVTVQGVESEEDWEPFEYRISVLVGELEIPLLIELADPREADRFRELKQPELVTVDLTAFVFEPQFFNSEEEFTNAQLEAGETTILAPNFFIPTGLFGETRSARAAFAGEILRAELRTTGDGAQHWWTLVEVIGSATVNVVFDISSVEQAPKPGELLVGEFWLSGQLP